MASFLMPTLYCCKPRTAFHVHTSHLLRNAIEVQRELAVKAAAANDAVGELDLDSQSDSSSSFKPKMCAEAIAQGLAEFQNGNFNQALDLFTVALELPGNGFVRMSGSPREYACPSEAEERAALYNMACCYSQLDEVESGLTVLRGLLEDGFDGFGNLRGDPDMEALRAAPEFEPLLREFENVATGIPLGVPLPFGGGGMEAQSKQPRKKSWLDPW